MKRTLTGLVLAAVAVLAPLSASAAEQDVHPDVAAALAAEPGGYATGYGSAVWPESDMRLDVGAEFGGAPQARSGEGLMVAAAGSGTCPVGSICAFSGGGTTGIRLSWSTCGTKSTAALGTVGSIENARSSGTLRAKQGTSTRATATPGIYANVPASFRVYVTHVVC